jgi:hypothetical protein
MEDTQASRSVHRLHHTMSALSCVTVLVATSRRDFSAAPLALCSTVNSRMPLEMVVCEKFEMKVTPKLTTATFTCRRGQGRSANFGNAHLVAYDHCPCGGSCIGCIQGWPSRLLGDSGLHLLHRTCQAAGCDAVLALD